MDIKKLTAKNPIVDKIAECREILWINPKMHAKGKASHGMSVSSNAKGSVPVVSIDDADARLHRFASFIKAEFPETGDGIIESELREISAMKDTLTAMEPENAAACKSAGIMPTSISGRLFLKCDSHLPVSGSIKARGGIYEVLKLAESIAMKEGGLKITDDYSVLAEDRYRNIFSGYKVAVGSTGNLGLSIGIISATMGFQVTVHMSADARQWKKDMLRAKGVKVVEYPDDYEAAVAQGRKEANADPRCHFVDDENSLDLFEGYSVAGKRLKTQLEVQGITIDEPHRLYVYLPCGVGGAPGGVAWGLKQYFGDNVICFFAEPTHAPCMTLGLATGLKNKIAVGDIGIDGKTEADGLAVGRPSALVSEVMDDLLTGCFTVDDAKLYPYLTMLEDTEGIFIEPSACAAFEGLRYTNGDKDIREKEAGEVDFPKPDENSVHIVWATGGNMVPEDEKTAYYERGRAK